MSDGSIKDVLALADAINARRQSDDRFAELLGEVSTALADITALMEKNAKAEAAEKPGGLDPEVLAKALAAALMAGLKNMPAPVIKVEAPAAQGSTWKRIDIDLNRDASGRIGNRLTLTRS